MDNYLDELSRVKELLIREPRGMNISEISEELEINRNSTAKYLDILTSLQEVEVRIQGKAKVYFLSQQVPISNLLKFSSNCFIILNQGLRIVQVNDAFLRHVNVKRKNLVQMKITEIPSAFFTNPALVSLANEAIQGKECRTEICKKTNSGVFYYMVTLTPTQFQDNSPGVIIIFENITEKKKFEIALKESEEKYRMLAETSKDLIAATDLNGAITYVSPAIETILGISAKEVIGKSGFAFLSKKDRQRIITQYKEYLAGNKSLPNLDVEAIRKDGIPVFLEYSVTPLERGGKIFGFLSIGRDITKRKRTEEALSRKTEKLQASERKFRAIFDQTIQFIGLMTPDGTLIEANRAGLDFCGVKESDVLGKPFWETAWWTHSKELQEKLRAAIQDAANGEFVRFEATHTAVDGSLHYVDFSLKPVMDEDGHVVLLIPEGRDITGRKHAEVALKQSERQLTDIIDHLPDATFAIDRQGTVIAWNHAIEEMTGVSANEIIGKGDYEYSVPFYGERRPILIDLILRDDDEIRGKYPNVQKKGDKFISEIYIQRLYGGRGAHLWFIASPLRDTNGSIFGAIESIRDVTDTKQAEEALQKKNTELKSFINNIPDMAWLKDANSNFIAANKAFGDAVGMDPEYLVNHTCEICFGAEAAKKFKEDDQRVMASGKQTIIEESIIDAKKNRIILETIKSPIQDISGKIIGTVGIARDVTRRKQAEEALQKAQAELEQRVKERTAELARVNVSLNAEIDERRQAEQNLRESEERYRALYCNNPSMVFTLDSKGNIISVNPFGANQLGYTVDELIGQPVLNIFYEPDRAAVAEQFKTCLQNPGIVYHWQFRKIRRDGSILWVEEVARAMGGPGSDLNVLVVCQDITERKRAEEKLAESEEKYRLIFDSFVDIYYVTDMQGTVTNISPSLKKLSGYDLNDVIGHNVRDFYAVPKQRNAMLDELHRNGFVDDYIADLKDKDGRIVPVSVNSNIIYDENGKPVRIEGAIRDVTKRKQAEDALHLANTKLNLLSSFTRHDTLNSLTALTGFLDEMKMSLKDPRMLTLLDKNQQIAEIIRSQIEFTQAYQDLGIKKPTWQNIHGLCTRIIPKNDIIAVHLPPPDLEVFADPLLERVFYNLYDNASSHGERTSVFTIRYLHEANRLKIFVEDNGVGIPPDKKKTIFRRGTGHKGFGLFLAGEVLSLTGITIEESGTEGKGARFEITVPKEAYRFTAGAQQEDT